MLFFCFTVIFEILVIYYSIFAEKCEFVYQKSNWKAEPGIPSELRKILSALTIAVSMLNIKTIVKVLINFFAK